MYVKSSDGGMTFTRSEYTVPANYRGNAFTADEAQSAVNDSYNEESKPRQESDACGGIDSLKASSDANASEAEGARRMSADDLLIAGLILIMLKSSEGELERSAVMILILCRLLFGS